VSRGTSHPSDGAIPSLTRVLTPADPLRHHRRGVGARLPSGLGWGRPEHERGAARAVAPRTRRHPAPGAPRRARRAVGV